MTLVHGPGHAVQPFPSHGLRFIAGDEGQSFGVQRQEPGGKCVLAGQAGTADVVHGSPSPKIRRRAWRPHGAADHATGMVILGYLRFASRAKPWPGLAPIGVELIGRRGKPPIHTRHPTRHVSPGLAPMSAKTGQQIGQRPLITRHGSARPGYRSPHIRSVRADGLVEPDHDEKAPPNTPLAMLSQRALGSTRGSARRGIPLEPRSYNTAAPRGGMGSRICLVWLLALGHPGTI